MTFSTLAILIVRSKLQESCHGLILNSNLGYDDDSLVVVGIDSSMTYVNLGPGADKAAFTLCNFVTLMVDGGSGTDIVSLITSTIRTFYQLNLH